MSRHPLKLTDEVISQIEACHSYVGGLEVKELTAAIRTLRDRARAVVGSIGEPFVTRRGKRVAVDADYIDALREVLPE
jgi:hypothetical protein